MIKLYLCLLIFLFTTSCVNFSSDVRTSSGFQSRQRFGIQFPILVLRRDFRTTRLDVRDPRNPSHPSSLVVLSDGERATRSREQTGKTHDHGVIFLCAKFS